MLCNLSAVQMVVMVTVFLICWTPYALLSLATILGYAKVKEVEFVNKTDHFVIRFTVWSLLICFLPLFARYQKLLVKQ